MSEEAMDALVQLYFWLKKRHPGEIHCAMDLKIDGWNRPADVAVDLADGRISAYWVFDRIPRNWNALRAGTPSHVTRHVLYTFSARTLTQEDKHLRLAAGQRGLASHSTFDERDDQVRLCFLESNMNTVHFYRGLSCDHEPNLYSWQQRRELPWSRCRLFSRTGEIVADDEREHQLALA